MYAEEILNEIAKPINKILKEFQNVQNIFCMES